MKFAFITSNLEGGGAQKAMVALASLVAKHDHETHLVLLEDRGVYEVPPHVRKSALVGKGRKLNTSWLGKRWLAWNLQRHVRKLESFDPFDAIISTLPFCDEVCWLADLPRLSFRIANHLGAQIATASPAKAVTLRRRYKAIYASRDLICVSDGVAEDMRNLLDGRTGEVVRIYNPFNFDEIRRLAAMQDAALPLGPYFVHAARYAPQKRHDLLIEAFGKTRSEAKLVLLCDPCEALDNLIRRSPRREDILVAGFQVNPYPWLARARVAVVCSDHEGMPNILVDALACGTTVVSTDCPSGPREVLGQAAAHRLVPCGHAEKLAKAMDEAFEDTSPLEIDLSRFSAHEAVRSLVSIASRNPVLRSA